MAVVYVLDWHYGNCYTRIVTVVRDTERRRTTLTNPFFEEE